VTDAAPEAELEAELQHMVELVMTGLEASRAATLEQLHRDYAVSPRCRCWLLSSRAQS
jgi:hypothetical protein